MEMQEITEVLVDKKALLEKFPGKGGWTYVRLPEIEPDAKNPFGWRRVKGLIDEMEIKRYHLMPMGNGQLFLPVKAAIRKKIKKEAGDWVNVTLYADNTPQEVPEEFISCLQDEPKAWQHFNKFSASAQKKYVDWIYGAKKEEMKIERMAEAITRISEGKKL